jgi:hypothetical protein
MQSLEGTPLVSRLTGAWCEQKLAVQESSSHISRDNESPATKLQIILLYRMELYSIPGF